MPTSARLPFAFPSLSAVARWLLAAVGLGLLSATEAQAEPTVSNNQLVLGFRASSGTGSASNLEVVLGPVTNYTNATGTFAITALAAADLTATYGSTWATSGRVSWSIIGTDGARNPTLYMTCTETWPGVQTDPYERANGAAQKPVSNLIAVVYAGINASATTTANSTQSAVIVASDPMSWSTNEDSTPAVSFGYFDITLFQNVMSIPSGSWAVSDLYQIASGSGPAVYVGSFGLKSDGTMMFSKTPAAFYPAGAPVITAQPQNKTAAAGGSVTFSVTAAGTGTLSYEWSKDGVVLTGQTGSTLTLASVTADDAGSYSVTVTNALSRAFSTAATLTVGKATPTVTWTTPADIVYGTALSATQLNATASVPGTFAYSPGAGAVLDAGSGRTLSVTFTPTDSTSYNSVTKTTTINVTRAPATVSLPNLTRNYDGTAQTVTATTLPSGLAVTVTYDGSATAPSAPGSYVVVATVANANYIGSATGTLVIGNAPPSLAWSAPAGITYGTRLSAAQLSATAGVPGTFTYSPAAGTLLAAGTGRTLSVTFTPTDSVHYAGATLTTSIDVAPAPLTVTANNVTRVYGAANPALTLAYSGFIAGEDAGSALATAPVAATSASASSATGVYPITVTGGSAANYSLTRIAGTLTITKATATVALSGLTVVYDGNPHAVTVATAPTGLATSVTYGGSPTAPAEVGSYTVVATVNETNYQGSATGTLTIGRAAPVLTWSAPAGITYGTRLSATQLAATASTPGTFTYSPAAGTLLAAGTGQTLSVTFTPADATRYTTATKTVTIDVARAALTVTADDKTRVYATNNPAFTVSYSGFIPGEDASVLTTAPTASATADTATGVGAYPIAVTGGSAANYSLTRIPGTLTITKAAASVFLSGLGATYDGTPRIVTASTSPAGLAVAITYDGSASPPTAAGSYAIVATVNETNYQGSATGTLTVAKAAQTISFAPIGSPSIDVPITLSATASSGLPVTFSIVSGNGSIAGNTFTAHDGNAVTVRASQAGDTNYAAAPAFDQTVTAGKTTATLALAGLSAIYDGTPKSATVTTEPAALDVIITYDGSTTPPAKAGSYQVVATINDIDYQGFASGTLTIAKAPLTIAADDQSRAFGEANPPLTLSYRGFVGHETTSVLSSQPDTATTATTESAVGDYPITVHGGTAENYAITLVDGTLHVTKAAAAVTLEPADLSQTYDAKTHPVSATTLPAGLVLKITYDDGTHGPLDTAPTSAGDYTVVATIDDPNHQGSATGTLTVEKAALTVTADDKSRAYGVDNPALTLTYAGFADGESSQVLSTQPVATTTATRTSTAGTYPITVTGGSAANYAITRVPGTLTISKVAANVALGNLTQTYDGSPRAATATTIPAGLAVAISYDGSPTAPTAIGSYAVSAAIVDDNYAGSATGTLRIGQITPSLGWTQPQAIIYGTPLTDAQLAATAAIAGTFAYSPAAGTVLAAGENQTLTVTFTPADSVHYATVTTTRTITVTPAPLTIAADALHRTYGAANPGLTLSYSGFVAGDTVASLRSLPEARTAASEASPVGDYPITLTGGAADNYTITLVAGTLTVDRAPLTITALDQRRAYGSANPSLTVSYRGFVLQETTTVFASLPVAATAATATSEPGTYPIKLTGGSAANYALSLVDGTLTIDKARATVTLANLAQDFDGTPRAVSVATVPAGLTLAVTYDGGTTAPTTAGSYAVVATVVDSHYQGVATGTLTIGRPRPDITWNAPAAITYGTALSAKQLNATAGVAGTFTYVPAAGALLHAGADQELTVTFTPADTAHYGVATAKRKITVNKAALTVTAQNQSRAYLAANPALTLAYAGFVAGDTAALLDTKPSASTTATASSVPGAYPIKLTGGSDRDYTLKLVNGTLTVTALDYAGVYFGTLSGGGKWALLVRANRTATWIAYLPNRSSAIVSPLTVSTIGAFSVAGTESIPTAASTTSTASAKAAATRTAAKFTLSGTIKPSGVSGSLSGLGETLSGARDKATGTVAAGLYNASTLNTASGSVTAIVGAAGKAVVVIVTPSSVDGASGTVNATTGSFAARSAAGAQITFTLTSASKTIAGKIAGTALTANFSGLADSVASTTRLIRFYAQGTAGTGTQVMTGSIGLAGTGSKQVLLRAIGPTLSRYGVTGPLADPTLKLFDAKTGLLKASNNNWGGSSAMNTLFAKLGAFALPTSSKDAALSLPLSATAYTVQILGAKSTTGLAMLQIYDADTSTAKRFSKAAVRAKSGTGSAQLAAGFEVKGNAPRRLLIRIVGPSLSKQGISGGISNPKLQVYSGSTKIAENDDWAGDAAVKAAIAQVGATAFASTTSKDSALLVTVAPGSYTLKVVGVNNVTGLALVEVYDVP